MKLRKQKRYTIYVGLADKNIHEQKVSMDKASSLVSAVCKNYKIPFSLVLQNGGYFHHDGAFVDEASMAISIIGAKEKLVKEIATDLCCFFNQESVMITCEKIAVCNIEESLLH